MVHGEGCNPLKFWRDLSAGVCCCLVLILIAGPSLLIAGLVLLARSTHDYRGEKIAQYNAAVEVWNSTAQAEFLQMANSVKFSFNTKAKPGGVFGGSSRDLRSGSFALLQANEGVSDVIKSPKEVFKTYTGWYLSAENALAKDNDMRDVDEKVLITIQQSRNNVTSSNVLIDTDFEAYEEISKSMSCSTNEETRYGSASDCKRRKCLDQGYRWKYTTNTCYADYFADSFCVLVNTASVGGNTLGGYYTVPSGKTDDLKSTDYCYKSNADGVLYGESKYGQVFATIRSSKDPHVILNSITGGSYNFGNTQEEDYKLGLTLTIIGSVILSLVCCPICWCCYTTFYETYVPRHPYASINSGKPATTVADPEYPALMGKSDSEYAPTAPEDVSPPAYN